MEMVRDPLVLTYETLKQIIKIVHGKDFLVFDEFPNADEFTKENKNAANISYVSGNLEKGLMREFIPHSLKRKDNLTYDVITETTRFNYIMQVSFFANKKGVAQRLSNEFMQYLEVKNEFELYNDPYKEVMQVFLTEPPYPPRGDSDLWQCDQTWKCRGKLLTVSKASEIDIKNFKLKIKNI